MVRPDQDWIDDQMHLDDDDEDDLIDCHLMADGNCGNAGSEWCDWSCPLNGERNANRIRKMKRKNQSELDL
jgi:hypothetical protein